ncbi:universal stress protein mj0531 [Quercus suber]|uniref:Universal stress protein mj0531 n=1 Tax=Quercus suber TaxID=58331 RepID=A0AAW0KTZ0_QUESU|nr:universal stress protein PHOS34-like [Quercus suber]POE81664.1 universal stress protein [Quercus suber]
MTETQKPVILVAVDESDHSFHALTWALDNFFAPTEDHNFKLIIVHAVVLPAPYRGLVKIGKGSSESLKAVDENLKRSAASTIQKAKEICSSKSIDDVSTEVSQGDPRNVLFEAVDKHHASILVLGSHGYGAIKRAVLGSVSDYCAHHCPCNVIIIKNPKPQR